MPILSREALGFIGALSLALVSPTAIGRTLQAPRGGAVRALIVGVDKYRSLGPAAQLGGAAADAKDIAQAITAAGVQTVPILDLEATRARFVAEMDKLVSESKDGDLAIVTFAGHGMQVPEYSQWKGIEPNGVNEQIALSGYSFFGDGAREIIVNKELRAWLARLDAKGVDALVIMDSCFGGGMTRGLDTRSSRMVIRALQGDAAKGDRDKFVPIQMTEKEAHAEVRTMSHVTFLAGATTNAVVPETSGLDPKDANAPRGALSYFVARAIAGAASKDEDLTREQLFKFSKQNVRQATNERQIIDIEPRVSDEKSLRKTVLRFSAGPASPAADSPPDSQNPDMSLADPIRVAVINGSAEALRGFEKGRAPYIASPSAMNSDLAWDFSNRDAIVRGDVVMHGVDGSLLGGVIDRTWAIRAVQKLSVSRILPIGLREDGKIYIPGDSPELIVSSIGGGYLTVFNIAADGELQLLFPTDKHGARVNVGDWTYHPTVAKPFGADHVVAAVSKRPPDAFLEWLNEHNHRRDAALVANELARWAAGDPSLKIGTVGLYTSATRN